MEETKNVPLKSLVIVFIVVLFFWANTHHLVSGSVPVEKVTDMAIAKNKPEECSKIRLINLMADTTQVELIGQCYHRFATEKKDETVCNNISGSRFLKNLCIEDVAILKNELSLCDEINDQLEKGSCYHDFVKKGANITICENVLPDPNDPDELSGMDLCYFGAVEGTLDVSICTEKIKQKSYKAQCFRTIAIKTKNSSLCDKINQLDTSDEYYKFETEECKRHSKSTYK